MTTVKMSRAFDIFGNIVSIDDVARGNKCNCTCLGCNSILIAKKGETRASHFSHDPNNKLKVECSWTPETEIHIIAKEIIKEDQSLVIPIGTINPKREYIIFDDVKLEVRQENRIPDVIAELNGEVFYIEVAVTHLCDEEKIRNYKLNNKNCLEINLSDYNVDGDFVSKDDLRDIINSECSSWISVAPSGYYALKINNHNREQIKNLHEKYKIDQDKFQQEIECLKRNIEYLQRDEKLLKLKHANAIKQLEMINRKVSNAQFLLDNIESDIKKSNSELEKIYKFEEVVDEHYKWYEDALERNDKRDKELEIRNSKLHTLKLNLDKEIEYLESKENELKCYESELKEKELRLDDIIDSRVILSIESKFNSLLKAKKDEIENLDRQIEKAEKEFSKIKRKYRSYIKF